ncbi:MAG: 2-C-methyl-D-erythritol 4-phosphate cytidylyltransferase [Phycisphaerales bacterium]
MNLAVIIPAAGSSRRYSESISAETGSDLVRSKLDEDLGGRPVLQRTVELFTKVNEVSTIIVAGPADSSAFAAFKDRHADKLGLLGVRLCQGGATHRYETVRNALALVPDSCTHVAVHDAARPCVSLELIERILRAAEHHAAVIPGLDVPDTLKRVAAETVVAPSDPLAGILGGDPRPLGRPVEATIDRTRVVSIQTPQVFSRDLLRRAYAQNDLGSTDDAQLVERLCEPVLVVPGESTNIKITHAPDLRLARMILNVKPPLEKPASMRF